MTTGSDQTAAAQEEMSKRRRCLGWVAPMHRAFNPFEIAWFLVNSPALEFKRNCNAGKKKKTIAWPKGVGITGNATLAMMRTVSPLAGFAGSEAYAALVYIQDSYETTTRIMESKKVFIRK